MRNELQLEWYKFSKQRLPFYGFAALLLLMIYSGLTSRDGRALMLSSFGAIQWIPIILIAIGSSCLDMEYRYHTVIMLRYKSSNLFKSYLAKLVIVYLYGVVLVFLALLLTLLLKGIFVGKQLSWLVLLGGRGSILQIAVLNLLATMIYLLFIVTMAFMLILIVKINAAVIGISLAIGFFGAGFSEALIKTFSSAANLLRWNPLNMILITQQLTNSQYTQISHLTNGEIVTGVVGYTLLFLLIGYQLFKERSV
ncbi:ABC transporter permease [Lapidilactobacillus wuchangensis]|uniref:ABC transporter permease n=1 Tax=Lapidilactobacillus wuchangensis TaxID=2486001 RepID=UPI000F76E2D5|nr:ABC transporter permease [Lapidilactobacillus wuchangensis]